MQTARTEAIKRQLPVSVCPSANPTNPAPTCGGGVFRGWIAFVDADSNCLRTAAVVPGVAGQPNTQETDPVNLIRNGGTIDPLVTVRSNGNCVSFAPTGFLQTPAGTVRASKTWFCDSRGMALQGGTNLSVTREIEVQRIGRSRVTRVPADFADLLIGPNGTCP